MDVGGEERDRGKKRVRTKGLQKKLLEQIEFYFGDANLQRDKFLGKKIKEHPDGYVPVEVIASFNKMKSLTTDVNMVVQVMKSSSLLEVTDDEKWVRRSRPLPTATDTDERTIYVEHLPPNSDQDSVRKLLKVFGDITYVSLPRHKISRKIKGFSFVEFATVEEANAVVEYFKSGAKPGTVSAQKQRKSSIEVKESDRGKTDLVESETERQKEKSEETVVESSEKSGGKGGGEGAKGGEEGGKGGEVIESKMEIEEVEGKKLEEIGKTKEIGNKEEVVHRKRTRETDTDVVNEAEEYAPMTKKSRSDEQREGVVPTDRDEQAHTAKGKKAEEVRGTEKGTVLTGQASANEEEASAEVPAQSRKRRRQEDGGEEEGGGKKGEGRSGIKSTRTDPDSPSNIVKHCKDSGRDGVGGGEIRLERLESQTTTDTGGEEEDEGLRTEGKKAKRRNRQHKKKDWEAALKSLKLRVMSKKEWLEMRKIFRDLQKEKIREMKERLEEAEGEEEKKRGKEYVGKCLVKVEGVGVGEGEDVVTIEKVKEICSKYGAVAYTDVKEGESEGYIRFAKSGCVENLVNAESLAHVKFSAVCDEEERAYYLKTVAARKQKQPWKKKRNIRGQDKIISRALQNQSHTMTQPSKSSSPVQTPTHIRFSESEHES